MHIFKVEEPLDPLFEMIRLYFNNSTFELQKRVHKKV